VAQLKGRRRISNSHFRALLFFIWVFGPARPSDAWHSDALLRSVIYAHSMSEDRLAAQDDMLAVMMTKSNAVN
jgi:hypothetical protein